MALVRKAGNVASLGALCVPALYGTAGHRLHRRLWSPRWHHRRRAVRGFDADAIVEVGDAVKRAFIALALALTFTTAHGEPASRYVRIS